MWIKTYRCLVCIKYPAARQSRLLSSVPLVCSCYYVAYIAKNMDQNQTTPEPVWIQVHIICYQKSSRRYTSIQGRRNKHTAFSRQNKLRRVDLGKRANVNTTVNSEIFTRIFFSGKVLKRIFAALKICVKGVINLYQQTIM